MRYLMLVCNPEVEDGTPEIESPGRWAEEMDRNGTRIMGDRIRPASDATTVKVRGGETVVSDGPYAETKELIAGFDVLECADLDEAIAVAAKHPFATWGAMEIRPFWPLGE
jgi:hypothetical protein